MDSKVSGSKEDIEFALKVMKETPKDANELQKEIMKQMRKVLQQAEQQPSFIFGQGYRPSKKQEYSITYEALRPLKVDEFGYYYEADELEGNQVKILKEKDNQDKSSNEKSSR